MARRRRRRPRRRATRSTIASGRAWRLSHQAGYPSRAVTEHRRDPGSCQVPLVIKRRRGHASLQWRASMTPEGQGNGQDSGPAIPPLGSLRMTAPSAADPIAPTAATTGDVAAVSVPTHIPMAAMTSPKPTSARVKL